MQHVAADRDRQALRSALAPADGEGVQQGLGRVLMRAVAGVDHAAATFWASRPSVASCKTQLSVPAAGASKPFGWAGAAAKPAAKAAPSRAAVAVDDDDDDRKSSPSKSASKNGPTIKGAIKSGSKRRDDDDDDDDDDRPRRRKHSKGAGAGGGAMLALIGGGVLCLGAIVGLSVWLLSDDGEKDTAKTENKTNNAAPVTPTGNPGNTGRDDRTGGGNGNGNGGAAAPDDSQGGGFAMKPGGGADPWRRPRAEAESTSGGNNPFTDWGQINNDSLGTPGPWAKHDGDGFSAEFPGTPGNRDMSANGMTMKITAVAGKSQPVAVVMMMQLPAAALQGNPRELISQIKAGISAQSGKPARDVTVSDFPGVEFNVTDGSGGGTMRLVLARDRIYMFIAGGDNKGGRSVMPKEDVTRFLNSATISYKGDSGNFASGEQPGPGSLGGPPTPGGGFGGALPGGIGIPQPPGGGFGGPPPGGIGIPQPPAGGPGGGAGRRSGKVQFQAGSNRLLELAAVRAVSGRADSDNPPAVGWAAPVESVAADSDRVAQVNPAVGWAGSAAGWTPIRLPSAHQPRGT